MRRPGAFIEVRVAAQVKICGLHEGKSFCAKACAGVVKSVTGIVDPYQVLGNPDIVINTAGLSPELTAHRIFGKL